MRKTLIICDRCGNEEKGNPLHICVDEVERENGELTTGGWDKTIEICVACAKELQIWMGQSSLKDDKAKPGQTPEKRESRPMKSRKTINTALVLEMKASGKSYRQIADELGFHANAVAVAARRELGKQGKGVDEGKIIALHAAGWKMKDIAGDMGIGVATVKAVVARMPG